jgi:Porin subfamily
MKMVKSLLLGSAAGLVAVAGAQAADLPVKAKAVEYVKICSLYGAGFYYIPGTDICMKVGGYVRFQQNFANGGNNASNGPTEGTGARNTRLDSQDWIMRTRAVATFDTRQQTQYGVLRTYLLTGFQQDSTAVPATSPAVYITRGFIQIAGFTFGKATSYYDFFPRAGVSYHAGNIFMSDTGDAGQMVAAYTAQFGGGVSVSIAAEQSQRKPTANLAAGGLLSATLGAPVADILGANGTTASATTGTAANNVLTGNPDIVANLRMDGTWGAFQVAGALHDASAGYYGTAATSQNETNGHPSNKWGWAGMAGLRLNAPMFGQGDYLVVAYSYTNGASQFASSSNSGSKLIRNGGQVAYGVLTDGVFNGATSATGSDIQLTTAWSVAAAYEHFWTPALQTSVYGSYIKVSHNAAATTMICAAGGAFSVSATCNPDFSQWNIGSRTQWNVVRGLYVGLDVIYAKLKSAQSGTGLVNSAGGSTFGPLAIADQSAWNFSFRVHRDVVP